MVEVVEREKKMREKNQTVKRLKGIMFERSKDPLGQAQPAHWSCCYMLSFM
jgi:hypothetical protein